MKEYSCFFEVQEKINGGKDMLLSHKITACSMACCNSRIFPSHGWTFNTSGVVWPILSPGLSFFLANLFRKYSVRIIASSPLSKVIRV
jgi:hypothetical protein